MPRDGDGHQHSVQRAAAEVDAVIEELGGVPEHLASLGLDPDGVIDAAADQAACLAITLVDGGFLKDSEAAVREWEALSLALVLRGIAIGVQLERTRPSSPANLGT